VKQVDFVYFNAGGGHRAAALALEKAIAQQRKPWKVRLLNLSDVVDPQGGLRKLLGVSLEDFYNMRLRRGWTLGLAQELKLLQALIRLAHAPMLKALTQHWAASEPDMVVSLVPNFNRVMEQAVHSSLPEVPYVTVMTDLADHPPHFWMEDGSSSYMVCGSQRAVGQARVRGIAPDKVFLTSGMVLNPAFYEPLRCDPLAEREAMGLDPHRPTAVVLFGGHGSQQMLSVAEQLDEVQLVLLCGHNEALAQRLRRLRRTAPHAVLGFTKDMPKALRLGDFLIGKPGPGCLSEAVHMGLPVITFLNSATMPQERYNARWVQEQGVGLVVSSLSQLPSAARSLIADLPTYWAATRRIDNRAVYEVVQILEDLFATDGLMHRPSRLDLKTQRFRAAGATAPASSA
jgi:UDP-N-acetylglucosamine:LPS N-acetylglucosamine transferase